MTVAENINKNQTIENGSGRRHLCAYLNHCLLYLTDKKTCVHELFTKPFASHKARYMRSGLRR